MNNLRFLLISATFLLSSSLTSQTSMSLQECVDYAVENHLSIKNATLNEQKYEAQIIEARSAGLPQVNGAIQGVGNPKIQSQFVPEGTFGPNPDGSPTNPNRVVGIALAVPYSADASITATQLLFNNSYFVGLEGAKTYREISVKQKDKEIEDVKVSVTKAYYGVLIAQEREKLLLANLAQIESQKSDLQIMVKEGLMERIDLVQLTVLQNNLLSQLDQVRSLFRINENLLKFNMGMPYSEVFLLSEKLEDILARTEVAKATELDVENKIDFQLLQIQGRINDLILSDLKMKVLPDAGLFGTIGGNYGAIKLSENPIFKFNENWASYARVGFNVNIPIFSSGRYRSKVNQAKIDVEMHKNQMDLAKQGFEFEYNQHLESFLNYKSSMQRLKTNQELAQEVYENAQIKYKNGVGTSAAIVVAETSLKEAQNNYLSAVYDLLVTKVDLDKSAGSFK